MSGVAAGVLALGVVAGTAGSGLVGDPPAPVVALAAGADDAGISVGVIGGTLPSSPETLDQIFALLDRAERAAHEEGRTITPAISQAAAELGMLITAYLSQQVAVDTYDGLTDGTWTPSLLGLVPRGPAALGLQDGTTALQPLNPLRAADAQGGAADGPAADGGVAGSAADADDPAADVDSDDPAAGVDADDPTADGGTAVPAAGVDPDDPAADVDPDDPTADVDSDGSTADLDPDDAADSVDPDASAAEQTEVTFDDVVLAAMRLATLLDSEGAYPVAVGRAPLLGSGEDTPLTTMLREAVERFGTSTAGYENGRIPADVLCALPFAPGHRLRCDAAAQLVALNEAYEAQFGRSIPMTDSYRTLESQVRLKVVKPRLAATPGRSLHGWGIAVDLAAPISSGRSPEYLWLRLNGPDYGWDNPSWARLDGSKPEPWHFEFFAAGPVPNRAISPEDVAQYRAASEGSAPERSTTRRPPAAPGSQVLPVMPTPTPKPTVTPTPTPTPTVTPKPTVTPTPVPTTPTTPTPSPSPSDEPTPSPSDEPTPSPSPSDEPTPTPSDEPATPDPSPSDEPTPTPSDEPATPDPSPSDEPATPDPSPSDEPTAPDPSPSDEPATSPSDEPTDAPPSDEPTGVSDDQQTDVAAPTSPDPGVTQAPQGTSGRDSEADPEPEPDPEPDPEPTPPDPAV